MGAFEDLGYRAATATGHRCAVPNCPEVPPRSCVFCPTHHFALPPAYARAVLRAKIACERAEPGAAADQARATYSSTLRSCLNSLSHEARP